MQQKESEGGQTKCHMPCAKAPVCSTRSRMPSALGCACKLYISMSLRTGANDCGLMNMGIVAVGSIPSLERSFLGHGINLPVSTAATTVWLTIINTYIIHELALLCT